MCKFPQPLDPSAQTVNPSVVCNVLILLQLHLDSAYAYNMVSQLIHKNLSNLGLSFLYKVPFTIETLSNGIPCFLNSSAFYT